MRAAAGLPSVRRRILLGATLILGLLLGTLAVIARQYSERAADEAFDRVLSAAALSIADALQLEEGFVTVDVPQAAFDMLAASRSTRVFYRVIAPNGAFLTGYPDLAADEPDPRNATVQLKDIRYRGEAVRLVSVGRFIASGETADWAVVQVAETREARDALRDELFRTILLPSALAGLIAFALVFVGLNRAFAPFARLRAEVAGRSSTDLAPIESAYPREVAALVSVLNAFMGRLSTSFATTRTLVADAAHQLRTPIAALQAQAELALHETDPDARQRRIGRIHANAQVIAQLQSQLLASATVSHRLDAQPRRPVTLASVVAAVIDGLDDDQLARIDLAAGDGDAAVLAEPVALREMLRNIVDNAFAYAPSGPIRIRLSADERWATLTVSDRGPGIPRAERTDVLERFRRGSRSAGTPGSGLGLSIARDVAEALDGRLELDDTPGGGLTVRIGLPRIPAATPSAGGAAPLVMAMAGLALGLATAWPGAPARADMRLFPAANATETLRIAADGEHRVMAVLIEAFQARHPGIAVEYHALPSGLVYQSVVTAAVSGSGPDLAIGGAVDMQVRLVNDGYAQPVVSPRLPAVPDWARWRDELIGLTYEPLVLAYDPKVLPDADRPRTRLRLAQLLETNRAMFRGKVVTYDIGRSGIGYIHAALEAGVSPVAWRLMRSFGEVEAQIAGTGIEMLEALSRGDASIAFSLAASPEVRARAEELGIPLVETEDYQIVTTRTALIPRAARSPAAARLFLEFALSPEGQAVFGAAALIGRDAPPSRRAGAPVTTVPLGVAMLSYSDQRKRGRFLDTWIQLVLKP
ncbi:MAG: extracellular solute-binding protein [Burkholderiales bacterium]|nr:extracellular solute-binding protein [Burkholderiales bacterium]